MDAVIGKSSESSSSKSGVFTGIGLVLIVAVGTGIMVRLEYNKRLNVVSSNDTIVGIMQQFDVCSNELSGSINRYMCVKDIISSIKVYKPQTVCPPNFEPVIVPPLKGNR